MRRDPSYGDVSCAGRWIAPDPSPLPILHRSRSFTRLTDEEREGGSVGRTTAVAGTSPHAGTVGLRSVRERVELVGGRLDVDSAPGRGTRAVIELPV